MRVIRSAMVVSMMASVSPLAAQSILTDRPGALIAVQPASQPQGQVIRTPDAGALLTTEATGGVVLETRNGSQGAIVSSRPAGGAVLEVPEVAATPEPQRPSPRPQDLVVPPVVAEVAVEPAPVEPDVPAVTIVTRYDGPLPAQRPREVAGLAGTEPVAARALVAERPVETPDPVEEDVVAAVQIPEGPPPLAPTPSVVDEVREMSIGHVAAARAAVALPGPVSPARQAAQPDAFDLPSDDTAPVLSRPLPSGPALVDEIAALAPGGAASLSAVLLPGVSALPGRAMQPGRSAEPVSERFPMSALPPGVLPGGPESQSFVRAPVARAPVSNAAVLMSDRAPAAPARIAPIALPEIPRAGEPPRDPEAPPILPAPDVGALARMVTETEICWQYADLHGDAAWASLSVDVALDEMNMPTLESVRLTGFAHAMSSSAAEAFQAARGALSACAEATTAEPATAAATLVFDREGVRLR